jgi:hypothetical protein
MITGTTTTFMVCQQKMAMLLLLRFLLWSTSCSDVNGFSTVATITRSSGSNAMMIPSRATRSHHRQHLRHNILSILHARDPQSSGRGGKEKEDDDDDLWALVVEANGQTVENGKDFFVAKSAQNNNISKKEDNNNQSDVADEKVLQLSGSKRIHFRLDGLEPYVLVSAITSTASFEALTQGNAFADNDFVFGMDHVLPSLLLISCTASSVLGLYALGIFSLSILYSKAALGSRQSTKTYQDFFDKTSHYRYKAFENFLKSLVLFVVDIFLFALSYFPTNMQGAAAVVGALVTFWCWQDWKAIVDAANYIFQVDEDTTTGGGGGGD